MKKLLLLVLLLHASQPLLAQTTKHNSFYSTRRIEKKQPEKQLISLDSTITSIAIELTDNQHFKKLSLQTNQEKFTFVKDIHSDLNISNLIVFNVPITEFTVENQTNSDLTLHLFYAPPLPARESKAYRIEEPCERGNVITGAQWRVGLPAPREAPVATQVRHVIVHHAAGSNTATNYTEVVRNIFLLHTQTNGWNDIGYNYLVAQDGTVFEGRLGQGSLETDNVLGAHFCGKNTNTMGICLLGDYQTANPPQPMLTSLYRTIAWKLRKENLPNVFASALHPQGNASATMLGVISGHRDGCNTDCPGDNVYRQLAQIKTEVSKVCNVLANEDIIFEDKLQIYPQPASEEVFISSNSNIDQILVCDLAGKEVLEVRLLGGQSNLKISLKNLKSGIYILKIAQKGTFVSKKLWVE